MQREGDYFGGISVTISGNGVRWFPIQSFDEMPRKKKQAFNPPAILVFFGFIFCFYLLDHLETQDVAFLFCLVVFALGTPFLLKIYVQRSRRQAVVNQVDSITDLHMEALIRQRNVQIRSDAYGKPILSKWNAELEYFLEHHVRPTIKGRKVELFDKERAALLQHISRRIGDEAAKRPAFTDIPAKMTPAEFEVFCAERLKACGWEVQVTPLSRDQGVDVIAHKVGTRVVLQCKLYSNPVGNKAVQEVSAGRIHHQATFGAVVTNSSFTTSAKELASSNGILLIHHTELADLERMVIGRTAVHPA